MARTTKYLDSAHQVFFWEIDEAVPMLLMLGLGIFMHKLLYTLPIGITISKMISMTKSKGVKGLFFHRLYWYGLLPLKNMPNPFIKEYVE